MPMDKTSRPSAICCPHCGRVVELVEMACNYPCERCGVLWQWYYRPGMREEFEIESLGADHANG